MAVCLLLVLGKTPTTVFLVDNQQWLFLFLLVGPLTKGRLVFLGRITKCRQPSLIALITFRLNITI